MRELAKALMEKRSTNAILTHLLHFLVNREEEDNAFEYLGTIP